LTFLNFSQFSTAHHNFLEKAALFGLFANLSKETDGFFSVGKYLFNLF